MTLVNCNGQSNNKNFSLFLSKFNDFKFPANPTELLAERERNGDYQKIRISKKDYDEFLRERGDLFWVFNKNFEYSSIEKMRFDNFWILIYYRGFLVDDVNLQKSEFILSTFSLEGKMISSLPVTGGYGDSLTFTSTISNSKQIAINYTLYSEDKEDKYTKCYYIDENGMIKERN